MIPFNDFLAERLKDPDFRREWDRMQPERVILNSLLEAQNKHQWSTEELLERSGLTSKNLADLEDGNGRLRLEQLKQMAYRMGFEARLALY